MSLEQRITTDLKTAMKAKDKVALRGIRAIKSAILLAKTDGSGSTLDEAGEVKMLQASFGISKPFDPEHRLYDVKLAGGALLDVGIYPITFAQMILQETPNEISASAHIGPSHVDESNAMTFKYENGVIASLNSSITTKTSHEAWIYGTKGNIKIPSFWHPQTAQLNTDITDESVTIEHVINGYEYEIEEVHKCLEAQLLESPKMSWESSKTIMKIMDEVRSQIGLKYPNEASS